MPAKELVIVSGKGGTGKTSLVAAFASLAPSTVLADCDVDAADLHLVLAPAIRQRHEFRAGHKAVIAPATCIRCGFCLSRCRFDAIRWKNSGNTVEYAVDPLACEGCGVCVDTCPADAITFPSQLAGEWFESDTAHGPLVHARLGIAAENSGKLVSEVRRRAREIAHERHLEWILVDGPPGTGCPVISSIAGAALALIVTEPTLSGQHDLERVVELARHFNVPAAVCVNKWDLNPALCAAIEASATTLGARPIGRLRYDRAVTAAQVAGKSVLDGASGEIAGDIASLWKALTVLMNSNGKL